MSFVADHVRRVGGQLDRLHLSKQLRPLPQSGYAAQEQEQDHPVEGRADEDIERLTKLQGAIKALSTFSSAQASAPPELLIALLEETLLVNPNGASSDPDGSRSHSDAPSRDSILEPELDLQWLLISKAAIQAYGLVLSTLLNQTIQLGDDIYYWNQVLSSPKYSGLYTIQTSPIRLWHWATDVYEDSRERLQRLVSETEGAREQEGPSVSLSDRWRKFYGLVRESIRDRSLADVQSRLMTPFTQAQMDARSKLSRVKRFRELNASGLGVLMDEGLSFDTQDDESISSKQGEKENSEEWKTVVAKSVTLMESVIRNITSIELKARDFEETVFMSVDEGPDESRDDNATSQSAPSALALRLQELLNTQMPSHIQSSHKLAATYGKPSRWIRYWLPGLALALSSSTLLRIGFNRKAELIQWARDLLTTTVDFWNNWIVEPVKNIIGTIRHDKDSEIAIMSKESLRGDQASLERMVVDFATDHPDTVSKKALTEAEIVEVREKVKEGDLTPILKAYEKDLRRPFMGTVRGELVRALLIQGQKTKVDIEVAVAGIDNLLRSQELVFGFVGLTPSLLIIFAVTNWLGGTIAGRRGQNQSRRHGSLLRPLRNIDRILSAASPVNNGMLSYSEHGLLLCEVHVLRQRAEKMLPGEVNVEFLEEINDLVDLRTGIERQMRVVERIRWAYGKWL